MDKIIELLYNYTDKNMTLAQLRQAAEIEDDFLLTTFLASAYNCYVITHYGERNSLITNIDALKISENEFQIFLQDTQTYINACIAELERIVDLEDDAINEGLFERITKKIVVYPLNILEIHLSFMTMPIRLQYSTSGKGEFYKVEFKLLTQSEFAEIVATAPRNEIQDS